MNTSYSQLQLSELNVEREVSDAFFDEPWIKTRIRALAAIERKPADFGTTLEETSALRKTLRARIHDVAQAYAHHAEALGHPDIDDAARYDYLRFQLAKVYKACEGIDSALHEFASQNIEGITLLHSLNAIGSPSVFRMKAEKLLSGIAAGLPDVPHHNVTLLNDHEEGRKAQLGMLYQPPHEINSEPTTNTAEPAPLSAAYVSQFPNMTTPPAPADDDTPALAIAEDAPAPNEPDPRQLKETLETLHYRREGLDAAQKLVLQHQIRAAIADIPLPERPLQAQQSWYTQLMNASKYRQEFMRSYENIPKPPSFQSTLVVKRQVEKALDQLASTVTETYQPGKTNPAIQQHFTALMDAIEQMVEKTPNAKAALGDANLRDALACVLYSAIEQGFENTAKLLNKGSHADQLQQERNQNGPSMRGH